MNPGIQNYGGFIKDPSLFIKNLPAMQAMWVPSLGGEDSLEEGKAPHFSILAWRIQWTEEPAGLRSTGAAKSWTRLSN